MLDKEYNYYLAHKESLYERYTDKYIVIKGEEIVGSYDSQETALTEATKKYDVGSFLIQKVSLKEEDNEQRFFSRVIVAA